VLEKYKINNYYLFTYAYKSNTVKVGMKKTDVQRSETRLV